MKAVLDSVGLVGRLAQRQAFQKYRDSSLGWLWSIANPLILLAVYSLVFGVVFESTWIGPDGTEGNYPLFLFSGLTLFLLYAEITNNSAFLAQNNALLIKRTTVQLGVLPRVLVTSAFINYLMNMVPFVVLYGVVYGIPPWTIVLYPGLVGLLVLLTAGLGKIIAALAAYIRDLQQVIPLANTMVLFLSPIFFASRELPGYLDVIVTYLSPLGVILPATKDVLFYGVVPSSGPLALYFVVAIGLNVIGTAVYRRASRGFADVV
jgi:lipopolysaccharide transport system permease protein